MDWEIRIDEAAKYIEIVTQGIADKHGSMEMAKKIAETMRHLRFTKAIIDHRNITTVSGTIMDVYERPKLFRLIGMIFGIRIAAVIKPEHLEHFRFLETVSYNNGHTYSVFFDKQSALNWLLRKNQHSA